MASQADARAVKTLNTGPGKQRHTFKTHLQKIAEIDPVKDVYRSTERVRAEPSEHSSFFLASLHHWRLHNTAEDFISFYEEMLPFVQTLPEVIHRKEEILSQLLSRLHMKGRLSIEAIISLIAELSRDLLDLFIQVPEVHRDAEFNNSSYLQRVAESLVLLLSSGADREPEIIEQIFNSWSRIMGYLQKDVIKAAVYVLEITKNLRFYPKEYIQEFMAESVSYVLRTAPDDQLESGVRKAMSDVVDEPSETRKYGVSALLSYVMMGSKSKLHSKAERVMRLLLDSKVIGSGDKDPEGSNPVVEVAITVFQLLCDELEPLQLKSLLQREEKEIRKCISTGDLLHLSHLLTIYISTMQINNVRKTIEFKPVLTLVKLLIERFIMPSSMLMEEDRSYAVIDNILRLMLCTLDGLHSRNLVTTHTEFLIQWAPVFEMRDRSFMTFIKELLSKDPSIVQTFRTSIISALTDLITSSEEEATYMLVKFFEKIESIKFCISEEKLRQGISGVCNFFKERITCWIGKMNDAEGPSCVEFGATDLAQMWGFISCYSYMADFQANSSLLMDFVESLDRLLMIKSERVAALPRQTWESLLGAGLVSYQKLRFSQTAGGDKLPVDKFLLLAKKYKSSIHILSAVADILDSLDASTTQSDGTCKKYHLELEAGKTVDAFNIFSENLYHSNKQIRLLTLRILCHYEPLNSENSPSNQPLENDMIIDHSDKLDASDHRDSVLHLLLTIEATPLSIATSRTVIRLITKIQMELSTRRICKAYIPLVFNSIIGVFHNRFNYLWNPAMECFAVLVGHNDYRELVWETCLKFLDKCVSNFISPQEHSEKVNSEIDDSRDELLSCFYAFVGPSYDDIPSHTVLSLLIKSLQKVVATLKESQSRQLIPLFLMFLGYEVSKISSVSSYSSQASKGKDWKGVLEDWLCLLKLIRNLKAFPQSQFLKDVLQYRLLDENDPDVQLKVLECLLNWKDEFLLPYDQNLRNLVNPKTLRDELTRWSLSRESQLVSEDHRDFLVPIVIRILVPKVRKLKKLASRKTASVHHRKAIIGFLAELDINELPLFFALLIKPLQTGSSGVGDVDESSLTTAIFDSSSVSRHFTLDNIRSLSSKKVYGFLHVTEEIIGIFDATRIEPVLDTLMGSVVRILASCAPTVDETKSMCIQEEDVGTEKQAMASLGSKHFKDLRSLCLKIISFVLGKFEGHNFSLESWDIFFSALKPLIDGFKQEGASSEKPSSLFVCFLAMSRSHKLVSLFHRAKNLVPDIFSILTVATASEAIISCVLKFVENLLNLDIDMESGATDVKGILHPNIDTLVYSLHHLFTCKSTDRKSLKSFGGRELNIFKLLPKYIQDPSIGIKFVDILLPTVTDKPHDWASCADTLYVIQKMIPMLGNEGSSRILNAISPLLIHAPSLVRLAICDVVDALAGSDPSLVHVAKLLREFNATSATELDALDYDIISGAYNKISIEFFCSVQEEHALIILSISGEIVPMFECWSNARIQNTVNNFILKYMGDAMNKETSVRKAWMDLLLKMANELPNVSKLESYLALHQGDPEHDFFNNIVHVQKHMRARALSRFCKVSTPLSEVVTSKVMLPLSFSMLLEVNDNKGEHLRNACIEAIAFISASMGWKQYYALLNRCFKELKLRPDRQKLFLRLICSILDKFHFSEVKTDNILPKVQNLLTLDTDNVNVNVSLVALKLLKQLPGDILELQLPTIIHRISNFLKSRLESVRDEARSALAACLKELGVEYLQVILKVLRSTLKRGFEVHVLGYTLNFILSKCLSAPESGKLDYCLEELLSVSVNDILGEVSEEKDVDKIASKMKETRKKKSFETLTLIAQNVTLQTQAMKLISPIKKNIQKQLTPKLKSKLETMLQHIASGIESNPTANPRDIFFFTYQLIKENAKDSYMITVFALRILHKRIKKLKKLKKDEQILGFLDPFVELLCSGLNASFGLPSLDSQADNIRSQLFAILHRSVNASSPLAESCIRMLTVLLKSTSLKLSKEHAQMLLQFSMFVDLERKPSSIALSLLREIVKRKVDVPEIYDLANQVAELMVTSTDELIRKKCSHIFLPFLLDYDLQKKRRQQHFDFLVSNLSYEHSTGREAVLEMLHAIIKKFQSPIVNELSKTLFVQLVLCLANDTEQQVRSMAGTAIKILADRVDSQSLRSILTNTLDWYSAKNQGLWSAAAQVLGLLVEVMKKRFAEYINTVLSIMREILPSAVKIIKDGQSDLSSGAAVPLWKEAYYSLVLFEKILGQFPERVLREDLEDMWGLICEFLLHPHIWLRNISNRLIALYFKRLESVCKGNGVSRMGSYFLTQPSRLFLLAVSFCSQLKASLNDEEANKCLQYNVETSILTLQLILGQQNEIQRFWSTINPDDEEILLRGFVILDSRKGRINYLQMGIVFECFRKISPKILDNNEAMDMVDQNDGQTFAYQMLLPLYKVSEGFAGKVISDDVKQNAQKVRDSIRDVIGVQNFVQVYNSIRKTLKAKRDMRSKDKKTTAAVNPMGNAKRKLRIAAKHKANKKRKIMTMKFGRSLR
ncbi:small subunit processome component 20 homolog isoform X1 [Tanacetum coccineum]